MTMDWLGRGEVRDELEIVALRGGGAAALDLGHWLPRIHFLDRPGGPPEGGVDGLFEAIGVESGRARHLLVREIRNLRRAWSEGACSRVLPQSAVIHTHVAAGPRACQIVRELSERNVRCTQAVLHFDGGPDLDAFQETVRGFYAAGLYRSRVVLTGDDLVDPVIRARLLSMLQGDLWSVVPEFRITWAQADSDLLDEPGWCDVAGTLVLSEYASARPDRVWRRIRASGMEVVGFDLPSSPTGRVRATRWLIQSYEQGLVEPVSTCWPYSAILGSLREWRLISPSCVRRAERSVRIDWDGAVSGCPRVNGQQDWPSGLDPVRYWDCAMEQIATGASGCCNAGRLMHRECTGDPWQACPSAACEVSRALLPVMLRGLRTSLVARPADGTRRTTVRSSTGPGNLEESHGTQIG